MFGNNLWGVLALICAVWVIYDVWAVNKKLTDGMKIVWTIVGLIFSIVAAIIYYFMYKR